MKGTCERNKTQIIQAILNFSFTHSEIQALNYDGVSEKVADS